MNICKCCDNTTNKTQTCSIEHGMIWRFLKNKNVSKNEIKEISNIKTDYKIRVKYYLWKNNMDKEPNCDSCGGKLSFKKILNGNFICSKECSKKLKIQEKVSKVCEVCEKLNCKSMKCISIKRELNKNKGDMSLEEYIKHLREFGKKDLFECFVLDKNRLTDYPNCKYCGKQHNKRRNSNFNDTCSLKCSLIYKGTSYTDILSYYERRGIPRLFLQSIDIYELGSIYNTKRKDIYECKCGNFYIKECPNGCVNRQHFNNLERFNREGFEDFIEDGKFDIKQSMSFFNCSSSTILRYLKFFNIEARTINTIEDDVIDNLMINGSAIKRNDRTLIKPYEIDIYIPSKNIGIEYNGLIFHSFGESKYSIFNNSDLEILNKNKHLLKTELCEKKGVNLYHIFENEYKSKKDIWISIINRNFITEIIDCSKSSIIFELISSYESDIFFKENSLDSYNKTEKNYTYKYNNEILLIISILKNDIQICINKNYKVMNIFSRIDTKVLKNKEIKLNRRYLDYSIIKELKNVGFTFKENTDINKYYISESNELKSHGLSGERVIYDCGYKIFINK